MSRVRILLPVFLIGTALFVGACSDSTAPDDPAGVLGGVTIEGNLDPGAGSFVLKTLEVTDGHDLPVRVQLIGSDLVTDPDGEIVSLMVAVHSLHPEPLYPPVMLMLMDFQPESVTVLNPDFLLPIYGPDGSPIGDDVYGFDYSQLLGDDGVLEPEETTEAKLWQFHSPGLASFGFGARAEFGLAPDLARIGGFCFHDENRNGMADPDEAPLPHGVVRVQGPGGDGFETFVQPDGHWALHVFEPGLYQVHFDPMIDTFAPIAFSTPNPLQVIITESPDGPLMSFLEADFGMYTDLPPGPPPIQFTDLSPDSLHFELWDLQDVQIIGGHLLQLDVGFSGCQPDHPFSLWMSGGFMESNPVQVNLVPVHDLAEDCDAYFTGTRMFNLWPLGQRYLEAYGPGVLLLNVIDFNGESHQLEWPLFPPD